MTANRTGIDAQEMLEHAGWVRDLARRLVVDASQADDVAQETWLAAIEGKPCEDRSLRPWLTRVARNLAGTRRRREERRRRRERASIAARPRETSSTVELVERAELQRLLVNEVMALEEPLRSTLLWRYFEGRSAAEISRRTGVPAATVRGRLKDGIDRLRQRLDRHHGGERSAWCVALAPVAFAGSIASTGVVGSAGAGGFGSTLSGVLAMQAAKKLGIGMVVVLAAAVVVVSLREPSPPTEVDDAVVESEAARTPEAGSNATKPATEVAERPASTTAGEVNVAANGSPVRAAIVDEAPSPVAGGSVRITVVDHGGEPVDAQVYVVGGETADRQLDRTKPIEPGGRARRDAATGEYRITSIPAATYRAVAVRQAGPRMVAGEPFELAVGETASVELVFPEGIVLYGRVFEEDGTGRIDGHIGASSTETGVHVSSRTDADGRYEMGGVVPGRYQLMSVNLPASGREPRPMTKNVTVPRDLARLEVNLGDEPRGETTIIGRVLKGGEPAAGRLVQMRYRNPDREGMEHWRNTSTDEDGAFRIRGAFAGSVFFNVSRPATRTARGGPPEFFVVDIPAVEEHRVELVYPDNVVRGRIKTAAGEAPAEGKVRLRISPASDLAGDPMLGFKSYSAPIDADGSFEIGEVPGGDYALVASAVDPETSIRSVVVVPDVFVRIGENDLGEIRLEREVTDVLVHVRDREGAPLEKAKVQVSREGVDLSALTTFVGRDGSARLDAAVAPGSYTFDVSCKGFAARRYRGVEIEGESAEVEFQLYRGGSVELTVTDGTGRELDSVLVAIADPEGAPLPDAGGSSFQSAAMHGEEMTDLDGRYVWQRLSPGEYRVSARLIGGAFAYGIVRVVDGETSRLDLTVPTTR